MKIFKKTTVGVLIALAAFSLFTACKGRTLKNIEPNGETVEVNIPEMQKEEAPASTPMPAAQQPAVSDSAETQTSTSSSGTTSV
ncbi:MAG: hypothetical protein NC097_08200 [Clostridium sp.]|nr:hypothetical protein [Prevotella sp.]MCM1429756.1 hypothetical protein [Clostridium sp.]MCM1474929.1 hypothetical protein [Muribaculaceae bacterium]